MATSGQAQPDEIRGNQSRNSGDLVGQIFSRRECCSPALREAEENVVFAIAAGLKCILTATDGWKDEAAAIAHMCERQACGQFGWVEIEIEFRQLFSAGEPDICNGQENRSRTGILKGSIDPGRRTRWRRSAEYRIPSDVKMINKRGGSLAGDEARNRARRKDHNAPCFEKSLHVDAAFNLSSLGSLILLGDAPSLVKEKQVPISTVKPQGIQANTRV